MNTFIEMLNKIGEELNIKITLLSDNWTKVLEKDNITNFITGYQFGLNNHGTGNIMDDKGLFWDLLKYKNIPIIEQKVIVNNYQKEEIKKYFHDNNDILVVKANISNAGREVYLVNNLDELFNIMDNLLVKHYSISICPYYQIKNEYRVIVLNNEIRLIFGKEKPYVIGDGTSTVLELAKESNDYYKDHEDKVLNPNYVPKQDEKVDISFKFNLSSGAKTITNIPENLKNIISDLAMKVVKEVNISFASIDIINTIDNEIMVLEANSGVTLNNFVLQNPSYYNIVYNIYKDAVKLMFTSKN